MNKYQPLGYRILLKVSIETKSAGGILIAQNERLAKAAIEHGEIVAIGPTAWKAYDDGQPWANIGDKVYFSKYGGKIVDLPDLPNTDDEYYIIIDDSNLLMRIGE